jgi:transcriptional regulator with XRE-family HTH domain
MDLKDQIRIHREAAGMTRRELSEALDVSEQSIVWWESGDHRPRMNRIQALNKALGVVLDVTEQGDAERPKGKDVLSAADPECLRMALAISRLPQEVKYAISVMILVGEAQSVGKQAKSFDFVTKANAKAESFSLKRTLHDVQGSEIAAGPKDGAKRRTNRHA